ncbi:MAG TPA: DUF917 domain-containing protein [Vicinamibacteria bacterium]|nr:DUF917 domain-containing protein [Vicinamibacteria bacterium]
MANTRAITLDEIESLAVGAWILGAGGGGNPYHSLLNLRELFRRERSFELLDPMALADDDWVAVVSNMGAPLVGEERLQSPETAAKAVEMMEGFLGVSFRGIMAVEVGGSNALQPFLASSTRNLPVVDADAMGRAFPEAQMTSFAIGGLRPYPLTLADIRDNGVIVSRAANWKWMERLSRKACTEVGSMAATCKAPRTGREVKEWGILYTTTKAIRIGNVVREARRRHDDPIDALVAAESGKILFRGKVKGVERRTTEGFLRGFAEIAGLDSDRGSVFRLEFQNEWAVGTLDGEVRVTVPDIICVIDTISGEAVGTETMRYGQRITIVALAAPPVLLTRAGLEYVGPRAFGYDIDFRSVFEA